VAIAEWREFVNGLGRAYFTMPGAPPNWKDGFIGQRSIDMSSITLSPRHIQKNIEKNDFTFIFVQSANQHQLTRASSRISVLSLEISAFERRPRR